MNEAAYELVIARADWERFVTQLSTQPRAWGVGLLRRNQHAAAVEFVTRTLEVLPAAPAGRQFLPLADWVAIAGAAGRGGGDVPTRIAALQPLPGQTFVLLVIGLGPERGGWDGYVVHRGEIQPLDGFRVIGAGSLCVRRETRPAGWEAGSSGPTGIAPSAAGMNSEAQSPALVDRWSRTRGAVGAAAWMQLAESRVALFGASRTGSLIAWQLAALGVRKLVLIDPDRLAVHNLNATVGFEERDVGQFKVEALARRLSRFRSDMAICGLPWPAADARVTDRIRDADLLVTCVDSDAPRLVAARWAAQWLKPHLDIGTGIQREADDRRTIAGDVRLLLPREGCVACVGGLRDLEQAQDDLLRGPGALPLKPAPHWHEQRAGSLITINSLAVSAGVQLWLDLLAGQLRHSHWTRLLWQPGRGLAVDDADVTGAAECPVCASPGRALQVRPAPLR